MEKDKSSTSIVRDLRFKTDRSTGITLPVREFRIKPQEKTYYDCCNLLFHPQKDVQDRLPDDPFSIMLASLSSSLSYAKSILGGQHPFIAEIEKESPEIYNRFILVYLRMIEDTLRYRPVRKSNGRLLDPQEALISALKYSVSVTDRYSIIFTVLSLATRKGGLEREQSVFAPFEYQINNEVKTIKLHQSMWHFTAKRKFFGELPAFGLRLPGIPFDIILLHPNPLSYLESLRQKAIPQLLSGFLNGRYYLPEQIRNGFSHLDYVLFHEIEPGHENNIMHPNNDSFDCGSGICIPTDGRPWLNHGQVLMPQRENYLAFPHEIRHILDDFLYPWGPVNEFIVTERRAIQEEIDTAERLGWQGDGYISETLRSEMEINNDLLLHGWSERGFEHNDTSNMREMYASLAKALHHPNGAFLLERTKKFLEDYLR